MLNTASYDIYNFNPTPIKRPIKYVKSYHTEEGIYFDLGGDYPIRIAGAPKNQKECEKANAYLDRMSTPILEYRYGSMIYGTTIEEALESERKTKEILKMYNFN